MSRREVAQFLDASGALDAVLRARAWSKTPCLTVLTYHRLHVDPKAQKFDEGVIDATPKEFEEQVATLRRYFNVIGTEELQGFLKGRPLPPNPAIITFDDGYRESYDVALPILQKHGVKAVFFIATSYVNERRLFWWDRISYIVKNSPCDAVEITYPYRRAFDFRAEARPLQHLLRLVKTEYALDVERFLEELARAARVPWDRELERGFADELVMTWDQVRALRRAGMEIQSHTRTHRVLQNVPLGELSWELAGARHDLEDQLNERIRAISYPVGHSIAQDPAIRDAVSRAGYEVGFSNGSGVSWLWNRFDPLDIRRVSVDVGWPMSYFRALLAIPSFATNAKPQGAGRRSYPDGTQTSLGSIITPARVELAPVLPNIEAELILQRVVTPEASQQLLTLESVGLESASLEPLTPNEPELDSEPALLGVELLPARGARTESQLQLRAVGGQ